MLEVKELEYIRLPNGNEVHNCKALYEDGRLVLVSTDHALFDKIVEGMKE